MSSNMLSGVAGAAALTAANYIGRKVFPGIAPRLDSLGRQAVRDTAQGVNADQPSEATTQATALTGDLAVNSMYYSVVGVGRAKHPELRGVLAGAAMGAAVVYLAPKFGYGERPVGEDWRGKAMAIGHFALGGLVAGLTYRVQRMTQ